MLEDHTPGSIGSHRTIVRTATRHLAFFGVAGPARPCGHGIAVTHVDSRVLVAMKHDGGDCPFPCVAGTSACSLSHRGECGGHISRSAACKTGMHAGGLVKRSTIADRFRQPQVVRERGKDAGGRPCMWSPSERDTSFVI